MKILIGIIANDFARISIFGASVTQLIPYTIKAGLDCDVEWLIGGDWCGARNTLAHLCIGKGYDALWFMDDDHAFAPNFLVKLAEHDLPLVMPVCLTRQPPYIPVQYIERNPELDEQYFPINVKSFPEDSGLVKLEAGGCAGMFIKREVLEAIEPPWFEYKERSEDIIFCEKAKEAGFDLYCDLSLRLGHASTAVIWPASDTGEWSVGITVGTNYQIRMPFEE